MIFTLITFGKLATEVLSHSMKYFFKKLILLMKNTYFNKMFRFYINSNCQFHFDFIYQKLVKFETLKSKK